MEHSDRLHALDAVRGLALLLGVALHGANAYVPEFPWVVRDTPSTSMAVAFYVVHIFRMTAFFFIAGFFAHLALHRKGRPAFVRDRLVRVGVPLVAGWFVLMPAMGLVIVLAAWAGVGPGEGGEALTTTPPESASVAELIVTQFPWGHLWFLWMLLGFYVIALTGRWVVHAVDRAGVLRRTIDAGVAWLVRSHVGALVLGAPVLALFLTNPEWRMWFGVPSPIQGLIPDRVSWLSFAVTFGFGWVLHRQVELLRVWERRWALNLALCLGTTTACLIIVGPNPVYAPAQAGTTTAVYAALYAVAIWTWVFALIGTALRFLSGFNAGRRYVADASYWIYLVHVPAVMALHAALVPLSWPPEGKFLVTVAVATLVCLVTYQAFVRHTFVGRVLNGRRGAAAGPAAAGAPA